jgi:anaphase-promoting complex subunit 2
MGDESSQIWKELNSNSPEGNWTVGEDQPGYYDDMKWEPTPIDASPDYRKTTSGDIVTILLNIYDSKEVFTKELQVILAERLLASKEYQVDKEVNATTSGANLDSQCRVDWGSRRGSFRPRM